MTQIEKNGRIVYSIRQLCKKRGISVTTLEKELGYGNGSIGKWSKAPKAPPYDRLFRIAQFFGVSVEQIAGEDSKAAQESEHLDEVYLRFARQAQDEGIAPGDIQLAIETINGIARCEDCGHEFSADLEKLWCPKCAGRRLTPLTGTDLTIKEIEAD